MNGPIVEWDLPLFTQNRDALLRVDAELEVAIAEVSQLNVAVDNGVRMAYAAAENAKARVDLHRDRLVPARMNATARAQEEQNFMLIGIFELLQSKGREYDAYRGYFESVRDYWLARSDLALAVGDSLPGQANVGTDTLDLDDVVPLSPNGVDMPRQKHEGRNHHQLEGDLQ